jgi:spore coat polysaccharide biosynthesis protein SpsF (cytidylyltransferase family)/spore coat polysaccharide biosynthesis predicted glycosyltransferase SpsG
MSERVVAIIGARLNSSRLPGKQLLDLAGRPLITHVVMRLRAMSGVDEIVLATTADDFNEPLVAWARSLDLPFLAYDGDVNNLMARVDTVVRQHAADIVMYVCGDSPLIDPPTLSKRLQMLKADPDGDVVDPPPLPDGRNYIHEGAAIYRRRFWDRMIDCAREPFELEHVGAVYHVLKKVLPEKVVYAPEEPIFSTIDHRISVDTPSDYRFMRRIYDDWYRTHGGETVVELRDVIGRIVNEPELRAINAHVRQKQVADTSAKVTLLTQCGPGVGLGHVSRMTVAASALQDFLSAGVSVLIEGPKSRHWELDILPHRYVEQLTEDVVIAHLEETQPDVLVADMADERDWLVPVVRRCRELGGRTVIVDKAWAIGEADINYFPSFYLSDETAALTNGRAVHGWDTFLLPTIPHQASISDAVRRCVILTGAADVDRLGNSWPDQLLAQIPDDVEITWVQGPFAEPPVVSQPRDTFKTLVAPENLAGLLFEFDAALCVYGVSLFESLLAGVPAVAVRPGERISAKEWQAFSESGVCVASEPADGPENLRILIGDGGLRKNLHRLGRQHMSGGGRRFAEIVSGLINDGKIGS